MLGVVIGLSSWVRRREGSFYRVSKNFILLLQKGTFRELTRKGGVSGLKPHAKRLKGAVSRDVMRLKVLKKYTFLTHFRWRYF